MTLNNDSKMVAYLAVSTLIDELPDGFQVRIAEGHERLANPDHLESCLCEPDEYAIVDLEQPEELQCLALLRVDFMPISSNNFDFV
jgi:hypothetical protein